MKEILVNTNRAAVRPNSAGRMLSLFVTGKKPPCGEMFLRISRLVDRKFIAQQRSIIFFVPKLTPLLDPFEQRGDRLHSCNGQDQAQPFTT